MNSDPVRNYESRLYKLEQIKKAEKPYKNLLFSNIDEEIDFVKSRISYHKKIQDGINKSYVPFEET